MAFHDVPFPFKAMGRTRKYRSGVDTDVQLDEIGLDNYLGYYMDLDNAPGSVEAECDFCVCPVCKLPGYRYLIDKTL